MSARAGQQRKKRARQVYPPEIRAQVMAALLAGQGVMETARAYKLPPSTVSRWKREGRKEAGRSEDVGELLLAYLRSGLETVIAQHAVMKAPEYLKQQPAGEMAVLHGVLVDKIVRLLEAMEVPDE